MANASLFLDKRRALVDGSYRLRIRVTDDRKSKYFATPYSFFDIKKNGEKSDYEKFITGTYLPDNVKKQRKEVYGMLEKAEDIINDLKPFNFSAFELRFTSKGDRSDLINLLTMRSEELRQEGNISNSNLYQQAANLLQSFAKETKKQEFLKIAEITPQVLTKFERWAVGKGYSLTTIGMYLVRTRAIFNTVMRAGELSRANYPFGKREHGLYPIPKAVNAKRPLPISEIMQMYNYEPQTDLQGFARDMFLFSYLANGMNMYDILKLRWSDFNKDSFSFIRKKTEHKKKDKITVLLNDDLRAILDRQGKHIIGNDYVFGILSPSMSKEEENKVVRRTVTSVNQQLKSIAKKLGIPTDISTYFARHSFATILMNSEAPLAFISKKLGHSDLATTQSYLDQFTKDQEEKFTSKLLDKNAV